MASGPDAGAQRRDESSEEKAAGRKQRGKSSEAKAAGRNQRAGSGETRAARRRQRDQGTKTKAKTSAERPEQQNRSSEIKVRASLRYAGRLVTRGGGRESTTNDEIG